MEHFVALCRASAAVAADREYATELTNMADDIAIGIQSRVVPAIRTDDDGDTSKS